MEGRFVVSYYYSHYRVTFTPVGEAPLILLDEGDWCAGPLAMEAEFAVQVEQTVLAAWAAHVCRGNAQMQLELTHYAPAVTLAAAQMTGVERQLFLSAHPEGELLLETAFAGPLPQVQMRLRASLQRVGWQELEDDIFAPARGVALSYAFAVSPTEV